MPGKRLHDRVCSEIGCGQRITHQSKTGRCRPCAIRRMHADPEYQRRRLAGLATYYDKPGVRERHGDRLRAAQANPTPAERERLREHGRWLYHAHASRPDVVAKAFAPEARRKAVESYVETRMGWCPLEKRDEYHDLVRNKHVPAAEARRIIEAEIPGTLEHARRQIANLQLVQQLRHERQTAERY